MSFKDRAGRSELLQTIQHQEEKIKRYESRLHDLVTAYRTILKEKATLEETVKATSNASNSQVDDESRVEVLTQSLASLTEDKQRMEANYQADRRRMLQENETLVQNLKQELESADIIRKELQKENGELRQRSRELKLQAERVDADQAHMLREMQGLLSKERGLREQLEFDLEEMKERVEARVANPPPVVVASKPVERSEMEEYQRRIRDLSNEVEQLRGRQTAAEGPIESLREELVSVKAEHRVQLQRELQRANEAERRLEDFTEQHEDRVSSLEARLTELSQTLGSYERTRESDQVAITKLRERVTQLDIENSALSRNKGREKSPESGCSDDSLEEEEQVSLLVKKLKEANMRATKPVDLTAIFQDSDENMHRRCRDELEQLKEEFERYKLKAQSVLLKQSAMTSSTDTVSREHADRLQQQCTRLRERCRTVQEELVNAERVNKRSQASLRRALEDAEAKHAEELESTRRAGDQRVAQLDEELKRHRNRTIALLAEKDEEMKGLRQASVGGIGGSAAAQNSMAAATVSALLREDGVAPAISSCSIIHCQEERARLQRENRAMRETKRDLDAREREWFVEKKELEEKIGSLERTARLRGRTETVGEGKVQASSLEYLKNVVLSYMTTTDLDGRRSMLRAIGTVLQFSPREMKKVEKMNSSGWFYASR